MKLIELESVDSTNKYLIKYFNEFDSFTFVKSKYQTNGKGRNKRRWYSPNGENLLFSFLLKEKDIIDNYKFLSITIASVILEKLNQLGMENVSLKWPNDIYVNDKKICGILLEGRIPEYIVVGVGLNVNQKEFSGIYRVTPTSIFLQLNRKIDINELFLSIENSLYKNVKNFEKYISFAIEHDYLKNKIYKYNDLEVLCLGIQKDGSLKIRNQNNKIEYLFSGELTL